MDKYQVMPPLTEQEYQELKSSIAEHGVQVAVEYDEDGNVLDGHHRLQACKELGIENIPKIVKVGMSEQQKLDYSLMVNTTRRQLTREQKQALIRQQLRQTPEKSDRQIAELVGVDNSTVSRNRQKMEETGQLLQCNSSIGADGKIRPRKPVTLYQPKESEVEVARELTKTAAPEFVNAAAEGQIPLKEAAALASFIPKEDQSEAVQRVALGEAQDIMEGLNQISEERRASDGDAFEPVDDSEERAVDHVNRTYCLLAEKVLDLGSNYPVIAQRLLATRNWTREEIIADLGDYIERLQGIKAALSKSSTNFLRVVK